MSKAQRAVCGIRFFSLAFTLHRPVFQAKETVPGVTSRALGPCCLDWFSERPALALACPWTDMICL
jgi:hypothetical protein